MWPIQLAFLCFIVCRIYLSSSTVCNTSFFTRGLQLTFSILLQHHISKLPRYIYDMFSSSFCRIIGCPDFFFWFAEFVIAEQGLPSLSKIELISKWIWHEFLFESNVRQMCWVSDACVNSSTKIYNARHSVDLFSAFCAVVLLCGEPDVLAGVVLVLIRARSWFLYVRQYWIVWARRFVTSSFRFVVLTSSTYTQ
jgi:hypothetical protein